MARMQEQEEEEEEEVFITKEKAGSQQLPSTRACRLCLHVQAAAHRMPWRGRGTTPGKMPFSSTTSMTPSSSHRMTRVDTTLHAAPFLVTAPDPIFEVTT